MKLDFLFEPRNPTARGVLEQHADQGSSLYYPNGIFIALFPSLFIFLTVLCFNFLGGGLRDALDPRSTHLA